METTTLLWILMIVGWMLLGSYASLNYNKKKTIARMETEHSAALSKEFHAAFKAGWDAASTDPIIIKNQYRKIFQTDQTQD